MAYSGIKFAPSWRVNGALYEGRTKKRWTMREMAERLGTNETYYCAIENGKLHASIKAYSRMAELLDISLASILDEVYLVD